MRETHWDFNGALWICDGCGGSRPGTIDGMANAVLRVHDETWYEVEAKGAVMELFKVVIEYADLNAKDDNDVCPIQQVERYVAVHGGFGATMAQDVCNATMRGVIGKPHPGMTDQQLWDRWQVMILSVERIGVVFVAVRPGEDM